LVFILNLLSELEFFKDIKVDNYFPMFLSILNSPDLLFQMFPFIFLITTQLFFIKLFTNNEIVIFRNNGINNLKLIGCISLLSLLIGILIISVFHLLSSNMKSAYLEFKNEYTTDNKYLAVINENGLWIKDILDRQIMIINSDKIESNLLKNLVITTYDDEFTNEINIIAKEAIITNKNWQIKDALVVDSTGKRESFENISFPTNFDYVKINSLFSNLESLNIFQLIKQKKDFERVGLSVSEIDIYLNKIVSLPISFVILVILTSILMLNFKFSRSKSFILIAGILLSVIIYYINYFFGLLGSNNKI